MRWYHQEGSWNRKRVIEHTIERSNLRDITSVMTDSSRNSYTQLASTRISCTPNRVPARRVRLSRRVRPWDNSRWSQGVRKRAFACKTIILWCNVPLNLLRVSLYSVLEQGRFLRRTFAFFLRFSSPCLSLSFPFFPVWLSLPVYSRSRIGNFQEQRTRSFVCWERCSVKFGSGICSTHSARVFSRYIVRLSSLPTKLKLI